MTFNTGNPIGSTDARDLSDNAENMDHLENSTTKLTHADRLGTVRKTRRGMEVEHDTQIAAHKAEHDNQMQSFENDFDGRLAGMAFTRVGSFTTGATLTDMRQVLVWEVSQGGDGHEYGWAGTFPKVVAAGATPATSGGIGAGAWVDRTDVTFRSDLASESGSGLVGYQPAGTGAVAATVQSKLREIISVKDFGAVGDGVADDTDAIQDAFDFLSSGQTLNFGSGNVYLLSGTVTLDSKTNVKLTGESELRMVTGWVTVGDPNPQIPAPPNNRIIQIKSCNGVTVDGLVLNGNMTNTPIHIYNGYGINAADSFDVRYENLTVKNLGGEGLMGEGTQRLWITNCRAENVNHAINVYGGCQQVFISNNYIQHNSFAVFVEGAVGVTIDGNIFSQTAVYTSQPRAGIVLKNTAGLGDLDHIAISNNIIRTNNLDNANTIWCNGGSGGSTKFGNVLISNNELHSPFKWGIKAEGTYGLITATGNQIHDAGRDGTYGDSGGILGIIAATGNYISCAAGASNAIALRNVGIAANNYTTGFFNEKYINDRTVVGVSRLTGNYPLNTDVFFKNYDNTNPSVLGKQTVVTRDDDNGIIYGFSDGVDGQIVTLIPRRPYTVYHNSESATQKIYTLSGSNLTLTTWTSARFYFDGTTWRQI